MYWVFGVRPSELEAFFWTVTLEDVKTGTEVKLGEMCAVGAEMSSSVIQIVDDTLGAIFGTGNKDESSDDAPAQTREEFIRAFNSVVDPD